MGWRPVLTSVWSIHGYLPTARNVQRPHFAVRHAIELLKESRHHLPLGNSCPPKLLTACNTAEKQRRADTHLTYDASDRDLSCRITRRRPALRSFRRWP